ncbi:MAG: hypothetical protein J6127_07860 [Clostridiales bacterium]|nr:hypothetical protein [Clostridiales bacterium]
MGDVYEFDVGDFYNGGMRNLYGLIAFITADLKDRGIENDDIDGIIEAILQIKIGHDSVWEEPVKELLDDAGERAESDSAEDLRRSIKECLKEDDEEDEE